MKIQQRAIEKIKPYPGNPRKNAQAVDPVAASIREFGFRQPIVVDSDGVVIVGHTRLQAAAQLGLATVPVTVASDLTPEQARAYRLADNRTGENAEWDADLLGIELDQLSGVFDLSLTGFTPEEIHNLMGLLESDFDPGTAEEQGKLDTLDPILVVCPGCGLEFDARKADAED